MGFVAVCTRGALACFLALAIAENTFAQSRPNALTMACSEVQALLASRGAATIATGPNTFDRFVGPGSCDGTRVGQPAYIATRDTSQCQVHVCGARVRRVD
ncbi:MAG: hypothetical protein ACRED5_14465 [Propylenella sp.]